ncbi:MAG TPA: alpha/beta hydrolase, partial [Steroidobacteraceae bacterium]|nr:alpha/beta hydrolase [Steroidobacteraceae bacterium]
AFRSIESVIAQSFRHFIGIPPFPCAPITVWLAERKVGFRARNLRPDAAIARLGTRPVLLIHGLDDVLIDPSNSRALHAAAPETSELWLVHGAPHAHAYQTLPEDYRARVLAFFSRALQGPV